MKFYVVTGSTLGTSEAAGETLVEELSQPATLLHSPNLEQIADATHLVFICSTHGAGEFPDTFLPLAQEIASSENPFPSLSKLLLIGIGSSDYDTYNGAIKELAKILASKGLEPVVEPILIDVTESFEPDLTAASLFKAHEDEFFA